MDFDEYDYLEKTVENPEAIKDSTNGDNVKAGDRDGKDRSRSSKRRSDEDGYGLEHWPKRARSEEETRERSERGERGKASRDRSELDRDRDRSRRGSSHHRSSPDYRSRDLDRVEKDRYRSSRERSERSSRDRERERDHDRERSDRNGKDKEREKLEKDKERDKMRDRDRESEQERSRRSRSHSERHRSDRDRDRERERERSKDRELKERERERELKEKDSRRFKERKEEVPEPEADPERDQRTVFAYQICLKADERDVYEFFSRAGKVRDVRLIMDRNSRRSKGVGYIEFYDAMSVPMAIALSGQLLLGQPVMVKPSEAEKNLVQSNAAVAGGAGGFIGPYSGGARRLYVGNLHFNITEDQLRQVFEPFGPVELVQLPTDPETGQCKGFGFVQFARLEDARAAQSLNGQLDIAGRIIKVSAVSEQVGMQDIAGNAGDFDDDDGGGLSLNARSRAILMQKLDRSGLATSVAGSVSAAPLANPALNLPGSTVPGISSVVAPLVPPVGQTTMPGYMGLHSSAVAAPAIAAPALDSIGVPSDCVLLKNMFDPNNEPEPDFDLDIKEDVHEECSKFGAVKHIFVDKHSAGHVYLRFESANSAIAAQRALHGRWFAGKTITATFMLPSSYEVKFPESK
eukprot:Gb_11513 [translate_table: standard]